MAQGGEISLSAYRDIKIGSSEGQVRSIQIIHNIHNHHHPQVILNAGSVRVPRLPIVSTNISANNYSKYPASKDITIYQVGIKIFAFVFIFTMLIGVLVQQWEDVPCTCYRLLLCQE